MRALAEIGLIVSIFLAFKYAMAALLPLVFSASLIVSYTTLRYVPELSFEEKLILMSSVCLVANALIMTCLCCYTSRKLKS